MYFAVMRQRWACILGLFLINQYLYASIDGSLSDSYIIISDTSFIDVEANISYEQVTDSSLLVFYKEILQVEIDKYPANFFDKIGIKYIVLGKGLNFDQQPRAAIPHPERQILYIDVSAEYLDEYIIHTFHHELHHCTEFSLWAEMYYVWKKWGKRNYKHFEYGIGAVEAYKEENATIDWYTPSHPKYGFVNLYATLGQEEDRCEIVALMMGDMERHYLFDLAAKDKRIKRKVKLMIRLLNKVSGTKRTYWQKMMNTM